MSPSALLGRRRLIRAGGVLGAASLAAAWTLRHAHATPESAKELLGKLVQGQAKEGRVQIKAPEIAENGNVVPLTVSVDSPMTDKDYVKAIHVVADGNPNPGVASFSFSPASGKAEAQTRVRLAGTQKLVAVAEMSDGSLFTAAVEVKVTIGGCGG